MTWDLRQFFLGYLACAHWLLPEECPDINIDRCGSKRKMVKDCKAFLADVAASKCGTAGWTAEQAGHDFFLTRNGHGAGFWDRYWAQDALCARGDKLSALCKPYGETDEYVHKGRWYSE